MDKELNKYYTPDIEEFCHGLEYEVGVLSNIEQVKQGEDPIYEDYATSTFDVLFDLKSIMNTSYDNGILTKISVPDCIRVKYLDREDVESLGFVQVDYDSFQFGEYWVELNPEYHNFIYTDVAGIERTLFRGQIKNKSELRKILKMVGVIKD